MTGEIVDFPGRAPPEGYSEQYIDKLHSEAFRDKAGFATAQAWRRSPLRRCSPKMTAPTAN
jgi:hypothetical protein